MATILLRLANLLLLMSIIYNGFIAYRTNHQATVKKVPIKSSYIAKKSPQKRHFSEEKTMAFVDSLTSAIAQVDFSLLADKLTVKSLHQTEKQWWDTVEQILSTANNHQIYLSIISCSFSQQEKQLFSQCTLKPLQDNESPQTLP